MKAKRIEIPSSSTMTRPSGSMLSGSNEILDELDELQSMKTEMADKSQRDDSRPVPSRD